jgi:hypothetical protein
LKTNHLATLAASPPFWVVGKRQIDLLIRHLVCEPSQG